jgi:uncharacterized Rmd1/YagE family protein
VFADSTMLRAHALRAEWYIVALIALEIALTVYELWVR